MTVHFFEVPFFAPGHSLQGKSKREEALGGLMALGFIDSLHVSG
jgi:hypothetical protein